MKAFGRQDQEAEASTEADGDARCRPGLGRKRLAPSLSREEEEEDYQDAITGYDGVLSEMIKDGGDVLHNCLLVIFNLMLNNHFPKQLSVGLITAVYKSGDKGDMSNYRGITVGSVIAKLFAMILDHRIAV